MRMDSKSIYLGRQLPVNFICFFLVNFEALQILSGIGKRKVLKVCTHRYITYYEGVVLLVYLMNILYETFVLMDFFFADIISFL